MTCPCKNVCADQECKTANDSRNKDFVEEVYDKYQWMPILGWLKVADPCVRKIATGVRMALLAGCQEVFFSHLTLGVIGRGDVMDAVTVITYRFVAGDIG